MVEAFAQRLGREDPGGGELERERETFQTAAYRRDRLDVLACQLEGTSGRLRAVDEELDRRIGDEGLDRVGIGRRWKRERAPMCRYALRPRRRIGVAGSGDKPYPERTPNSPIRAGLREPQST